MDCIQNICGDPARKERDIPMMNKKIFCNENDLLSLASVQRIIPVQERL